MRSFRKNCFQAKKKDEVAAAATAAGGMFIKVSMDGAPFLRKVDLKTYQGYPELLQALENMFKFSLGNFLKHGSRHHNRFRMKIYSTFVVFLQVSFAREKGITGRNLFQLMKIKMAIGCLSVTFPGSKFQSLPKITSMQLFSSSFIHICHDLKKSYQPNSTDTSEFDYELILIELADKFS